MSATLVAWCFSPSSPDDATGMASRVPASPSAEPLREGLTDTEWLARLRAGDAATFDGIVVQNFDRLANFASGIVRDVALSEDIVQDVFSHLWTHRATLAIGSLSAYLFRAVRNRALNATKRTALHRRLETPIRDVILSGMEEPRAEDEEADARLAAVRAGLDALPERRRTALRLRYEHELDYPAIADVLGISTNAAQQLVFHALRALRKVVRPGS